MGIRRDDLLFGAHSAIQKAVRRGDLDLAKTSFDLMWPEKKHRSWLRWRLTSIIQEDAFPMVGELTEFFEKSKGLTGKAEEDHWRKMIYRTVLAPANKDAGGLHHLAFNTPAANSEHDELAMTRFWFGEMKKSGNPGAAADDLFDDLCGSFDPSDYQKDALRVLKKRAGMGGMLWDRQCSIAAMIMVATRGMTQEQVLSGISEGADEWKKQTGRGKPQGVLIPWYSFDMHTQVGKIALGSFSKREKINQQELFNLWFLAESAFIPGWHCHWRKPSDETFGIYDSVWWPLALRHGLGEGLNKLSPKENLRWWKEDLRKDLKGLIEWLLKKRGEE